MFIYKCQKCGEPAVVFGDYVSCASCSHIITKATADHLELVESCNWLLTAMDKDCDIWIAIRSHDGCGEWVKKFRFLLKEANK